MEKLFLSLSLLSIVVCHQTDRGESINLRNQTSPQQTGTNRTGKANATVLSKMYNDIMLTYDKKFRPEHGETFTLVKLEVQVLSFSEFDEGAMEFEMDFYFAQFWEDYRFKVDSKHKDPIMNLIGKEVENLWLPDTVFINSKESKFHDVTINNRFLTINFSSGFLVYHSRITTKASCPMDLRDYPFDQQTCHLAIESYGHDESDLVYKWQDYNQKQCTGQCRMIFVYDKEMSNFDVVEAIKSDKKTPYHALTFSSATAQFKFRRRTKYFLLQVYLPCVLIVMVSWTTFWITPAAVPARSAICVTTILTLITMLGIVNVNMPKVSYVKALDLYLFLSFIFVFLSLLEYILVLNFASSSYKRKMKRKTGKKKGKSKNPFKGLLNGKLKQDSCKNGHHIVTNGVNARPRKSYLDHMKFSQEETVINFRNGSFSNTEKDDLYTDKEDLYDMDQHRTRAVITWSSTRTDKIARVMFPFVFTCFNIGYWSFYLSESSKFEKML